MKARQTRQLLAVFDAVSAARDHPTAEEVCARVRRQWPRVSLGTVYRNLQKLAAQQRVRVVRVGDRTARYDAMSEDHDHFACECCGAVTDLVRPRRTAQPGYAALGRAGYAARTHVLTFYGTCPQCGGTKARAHRRRTARRSD